MSNIENDVKIIKRYLENSSYKKSNSDFFKNGGWEIIDLEIAQAMSNIMNEREQLLKEKKDDKQDIKDFQNALNEENLRCANYAIENNELKKRIKELEAKLEFKKYGDLDEIEFEEYMSHFIPKQKVKDVLNDIYDYFERLNGPDEDIEYIESKRKELLEKGE